MKQIVTLLTPVNERITDLVESRQIYFDNRSENWQESEKGEQYLEKTELYQEMQETIEDWIYQLEEQ